MKGKCHRSYHMANNCSVIKDVKCKKCNSVGHIQAACFALGQARMTDDCPSSKTQSNPSLALEYQPENAQANYVLAFAGLGDHHSFATPPALL